MSAVQAQPVTGVVASATNGGGLSRHPSATRRFPVSLAVICVVIIALASISRLGMISRPFLNDSGLYALLGKTVADGQVLYQDFYETKLPGSAMLASVFWRAFGSHWAGYVACQLCLAMLAAAMLARVAGRHIQPQSAVPTFLFAAVFLNLSQAVYTGFQLETLQAFFEAMAAAAACESLMKRDHFATFACGLAAGMAVMAKPGGASIAIALLVMLLMQRRWRDVTSLFAGFLIPVAAVILFSVQTGAWPYLPGVIRDISRYASGTPFNVDSIVKLFAVTVVLGFPFVFRWRAPTGGTPMLRWFVILWFTIELMSILAQRRLYPYHFLPLVCPVALIYGLLSTGTKPIHLAAGLLPIALLSLTWEGSSLANSSINNSCMASSTYIMSHTTPNDSVFADQVGRLLIETDRKPGSRLGTFFYLVNSDQAPQQYMHMLLSDFEDRKPKYLLLPGDWDAPVPGLANCEILQNCPHRRDAFIAAWGLLRHYVCLHYHLETVIDGEQIYRRNETAKR